MARSADASQAAYFRGTLSDERDTANADLASARDRLRVLTERNQVLGLRGMARARFKVRELEGQLRELDRLIGALDRRFSALWPGGHTPVYGALTVGGPNRKG